MSEKEFLTSQLASLERQRAQALAQAQQCDGAMTLCRHRLAMLEREAAEAETSPTNRLPADVNGEA